MYVAPNLFHGDSTILNHNLNEFECKIENEILESQRWILAPSWIHLLHSQDFADPPDEDEALYLKCINCIPQKNKLIIYLGLQSRQRFFHPDCHESTSRTIRRKFELASEPCAKVTPTNFGQTPTGE